MNVTAIRIYSAFAIESTLEADFPYEDQFLELSLKDVPTTAPYIPKQMTGLEASDLSEFNGTPTAANNFGALQPRVIDARVLLNPLNALGKTVSELRDDFYRILRPYGSSEVYIRLYEDDVCIGECKGRLTRVEPDLFTSESSIIISITCSDPMFKACEKVDISFLDDTQVNELVHGMLNFRDDLSTAPHGLYLQLKHVDNITDPFWFTIETLRGNVEVNKLSFYTWLDAGSRITMCSIKGEEENTIIRGTQSGTTQFVSLLTADSTPLAVYPGLNTIRISGSRNFTVVSAWHYPTYWGV